MTFTRPESIRSKYEDRDKGEVRPESVEQAIRLAHDLLRSVGASVAPSKVTRLCRDYMTADPTGSFRSYVIRNVRAQVISLPLPSTRGHGIEWADPTGETACHNVDPTPAVANA